MRHIGDKLQSQANTQQTQMEAGLGKDRTVVCEVMRHPWGLEGGGGSHRSQPHRVGVGVQLDQCFTPYSGTRDLREPKDWAANDKHWPGGHRPL